MAKTLAAESAATIIAAIDGFIRSTVYDYSRWYVGITSDIDDRLFGFHQVSSGFAYHRAVNDAHARDVERAFLNAGCDGDQGGGDRSAVFVYAYLKTNKTRER